MNTSTPKQMKPSQQIAEELAEKAAIEWSHDEGATTSINHYILKEIPLTELIEVARVASSIELTDSECTCGSDPWRFCRYCGYFVKLGNKLETLRATGKVEI